MVCKIVDSRNRTKCLYHGLQLSPEYSHSRGLIQRGEDAPGGSGDNKMRRERGERDHEEKRDNRNA
jgi:hypothetical protein